MRPGSSCIGLGVLALTASTLLATAAPGALAADMVERVNISPTGTHVEANGFSPSVSGDGSTVAFMGYAQLPGDDVLTNHTLVRDRKAGTTSFVDVNTAGRPTTGGSGDSNFPLVSRAGRHVAFSSRASDLVPGDTNGHEDVFVRDLVAGTTVRASVKNGGAEIRGGRPSHSSVGAISADGRFVVFSTPGRVVANAGAFENVYVRDLKRRKTTLLTASVTGGPSDGRSYATSISGDGRFVAFASRANNLVANDGNPAEDVFVHDRTTGQTVLASVATGGAPASSASWSPHVSDDGTVVAFVSDARNLDRRDVSNHTDVYVRDLRAGTTVRITTTSSGKDANGSSDLQGISADGRYVLFSSSASNLTSGDANARSDVFVHDRQNKTMTRVTNAITGVDPNDSSRHAALSADGRIAVVESSASNLVPGDDNNEEDLFAFTLGGSTAR